MTTKLTLLAALCCLTTTASAATPDDGSVLPFPSTPMKDSVAKPRLQDSTMKWPSQPQRLPKDAPNILIILLDDVGFGVAETFGGEVHTPTLTKLAKPGTAVITVDGKEVGKAELKRTVPAAFTASESLDVGIDLGSTVSRDYFERRPFPFEGKIGTVLVELR